MQKTEKETTVHQKAVIDNVAQRLARGLHPMELKNQGKVNEATILSNDIGYLEGLGLMDLVDQRVKEIRVETDRPSLSSKALFDLPELVSPANGDEPKNDASSRKKPKQYVLEDLHKHYKYKTYPRKILQLAEAARDKRRFLKRIGYTDTATKREIQEASSLAILRLKEAGVWGLIESDQPLDQESRALIQEKLRQYDNQQRTQENK